MMTNDFELLRTLSAGDRADRRRLVAVVACAALGLVLVMLLWSAADALHERTTRSAWLDVGNDAEVVSGLQVPLRDGAHVADSVSAISSIDYVRGLPILELDVAVTGSPALRLPGGLPLPEPGEYVASPALQRLIAALPANELGDRYGTPVGVLPTGVLEGDETLAIVRGKTNAAVQAAGGYSVAGWSSDSFASAAYDGIAVAGSFALLLPVLMLLASITDLGGAQRAERLATLRLLGATPWRVARLAALEVALLALVGGMAGAAAFSVLSSVLRLSMPADRVVVAGLVPGFDVRALLVVGAVVIGSALVAGARALAGRIGPLGQQRPLIERRPSLLRLVPLAVGLFGLILIVLRHPAVTDASADTRSQETAALAICVLLVASGLLSAGPILLHAGARIAVPVARGAAATLALNRLVRNPRKAFRGVGGVAAAVFVSALVSGGMSVAVDPPTSSTTTTMVSAFLDADDSSNGALDTDKVDRWRSIPGLTGVALGVRSDEDSLRFVVRGEDAAALGLVPAEGSLSVDLGGLYGQSFAATPVPDIVRGRPGVVVIGTDGSAEATDRARTLLLSSGLPVRLVLHTPAERANQPSLLQDQRFKDLAVPALLFLSVTSGLTLATNTVAQLLDRRRLLALLRLTGMPLSALRRVLALETALPFVLAVTTAAIAGAACAEVVVQAVSAGRHIDGPGVALVAVIVAVAALLLLSLAVTFRAARTATLPSSIRFE
ncbi:FtsX-like permease family protein [Rathayibacter tritici]|nr:FtsX-like permease family protein [Rathayibacter tritici]